MSCKHHLSAAVVAASCLLPALALAEVMDKEPSLPGVWLWSLVASVLSVLLTRLRWWLVFLSLPVAAFLPVRIVLECHDPFVGPAILSEGGSDYVLQVYLALVLVVLANAVGLFLYRRAHALAVATRSPT